MFILDKRGVAIGFLASLLACSGGSSGGPDSGTGGAGGSAGGSPGSCAHGLNSCTTGTAFCCADYAGVFTAATVQSDCGNARVGGEYSPQPCTTVDLEGSCTLYKGTAAEKTIRYYVGYDAASNSDPATNCAALHGTFEAPSP
jgi:hypothetical protein